MARRRSPFAKVSADGAAGTNKWTQDGLGRSYVQSVLQTLDPGQSYQKQATTTQTLDVYGNVTQAVANNYAGFSPASRTQTVTYVTDTAYTSRYMRNRPFTVQV